jgi:23S rRNA (adenine2503-C2)-methyltransferase
MHPHLLGLRPRDLAALLREAGVSVRDGEARRVIAHVVGRGEPGFPTARPVPRTVERAVEELTSRRPLEVLDRVEDPADGFVKYLFRSPDGALGEAVRIPLQRAGRFTVCLSSQVGCSLGCAFCATGRLGLTRNLHAWEMVAAFAAVRDEAPGAVTGAVFMGQGEPLHNPREVIQAARVLSHPCGGRIKAEAISISTAGVVPEIRRFTRAGHPYRLIVSLTSTDEGRRAQLMPAAARWPLTELAGAIREHAAATGDRVTVAWVVLGGVNTGPDEVEGLHRLLGDVPLRVNLIDVNDIGETPYRRATPEELDAFRDGLRILGVPVVRRYSGGSAAGAACGMLASKASPSPDR